MDSNTDNSEIMATVLPVPDEGLKEEMRRYWKELKKWMIIGMIVCVISLLLAVIGTLLFVRKSQSYPQMPSFSQIRFIEETPQFPKALFAPQSYHSQFSINKRAGILYFKLALLRLNALGAKHVNPQLALAFCIVNCCTAVATPTLKLGTYIASIVLFFILFEQFNKAFTESAEA